MRARVFGRAYIYGSAERCLVPDATSTLRGSAFLLPSISGCQFVSLDMLLVLILLANPLLSLLAETSSASTFAAL